MTSDAIPATGTTDGIARILTARYRPRDPGALSAILTLGWRAMLRIKHVPFQLFDVTAFPIMFTLLFTFLFGGALEGSPRAYVQYLIPGILVQNIVFLTVYTGVGLNTDIMKGLFDRFRSLPMWQPAPIFGALVGDLFRYLLASAITLAVGFILGFRPAGGVTGVVLAVGLAMVFGLALSWLWMIVGMLVKSPESVMTTSFLFLMPLTFASDIFVKISTMPEWLQILVANNPVTQLATGSRGLMHGQDVGREIVWVLVASAVIAAAAAPVAMRMYRRER